MCIHIHISMVTWSWRRWCLTTRGWSETSVKVKINTNLIILDFWKMSECSWWDFGRRQELLYKDRRRGQQYLLEASWVRNITFSYHHWCASWPTKLPLQKIVVILTKHCLESNSLLWLLWIQMNDLGEASTVPAASRSTFFILILKLSSLAAGAIIDGGQKASWEPLLIVVGRSHQSVLTWNSLTGIWLKRHPVLKLQLLCHQKSPKVNIDWIWCFILAWRSQWCIWYKECRSCVDETLIRLICQKLAEDWSRLSPRQCMLDISHIIWQRRKKSSPMN